MEKLVKELQTYADRGFYEDIYKAVRHAQVATRLFIQRLHPSTAFGGKSLVYDEYNGRTHNQIVKGSFKTLADVVNANLYANYLSRFYNTGIYGRPPRGAVIDQNAEAIKQYFLNEVMVYLRKNISLNKRGD